MEFNVSFRGHISRTSDFTKLLFCAGGIFYVSRLVFKNHENQSADSVLKSAKRIAVFFRFGE